MAAEQKLVIHATAPELMALLEETAPLIDALPGSIRQPLADRLHDLHAVGGLYTEVVTAVEALDIHVVIKPSPVMLGLAAALRAGEHDRILRFAHGDVLDGCVS